MADGRVCDDAQEGSVAVESEAKASAGPGFWGPLCWMVTGGLMWMAIAAVFL